MIKNKPIMLDIFCKAGGASAGYQKAGFHVVGIDIEPQPNYCGDEFLQADALEILSRLLNGLPITTNKGNEYHLSDFSSIHASPPCQHASTIAKQQRTRRPGKYDHPNLIPQTRHMLIETGLPYVIENVEGAELINPVSLCGSWFGLDLRRHRLFESNFPMFATPCSHYWQKPRFRSLDKRRKTLASVIGVHGHINYSGEFELRQKAMGITWMTSDELSEAIPPAFTNYVGSYLMEAIKSHWKGNVMRMLDPTFGVMSPPVFSADGVMDNPDNHPSRR